MVGHSPQSYVPKTCVTKANIYGRLERVSCDQIVLLHHCVSTIRRGPWELTCLEICAEGDIDPAQVSKDTYVHTYRCPV